MLDVVSPPEIALAKSLFRQRGWLSRTSAEFQSAVLALCVWERYSAGTSLTHGGDTRGGMYGIAAGTIDVLSALGPAESPVVHISRAPFWFGVNPVLAGNPRVVTVMARTACMAARVPQHAIATLMNEQPEYWRFVALQLAETFTIALQAATDLLIPDSRRRCVAVLLRAANLRTGERANGVVGIGQEELSEMANLSRQTASTILRDLAAGGSISLGYRSIAILDAAALRAIVDVE